MRACEQEFPTEGDPNLSPTVLAAEEVLDGRVRSPRLKRKVGGDVESPSPRGRWPTFSRPANLLKDRRPGGGPVEQGLLGRLGEELIQNERFP